jgi:REP-associated tyrosine transposase
MLSGWIFGGDTRFLLPTTPKGCHSSCHRREPVEHWSRVTQKPPKGATLFISPFRRVISGTTRMPGAYCNLLYHLVFSTKDRRPLIDPKIKPRLREYVRGIVREEEGELLEFGGVADHVHLLVRLPSTRAVADALRMIKANSSKWVNEIVRHGPRFAWQEGYAAFTVSQSQVPRLLTYIGGQEKHHRKVDFRSELVALLRRNGVAFEDRFLL